MKKTTKIAIISFSIVLLLLILGGGFIIKNKQYEIARFKFLLTQFLNNSPSNQLSNTTWIALQYNGQDIQRDILLTIKNDSVGFDICNNIGYGKIKITEEKIFFHSQAASTLMACDEPLMGLETEFMRVFSEPADYVIEDDNLILTIGRNKVIFTKYLPPYSDVNMKDRLDALTFEKNSVLFEYFNDRTDALTEAFTMLTATRQIDGIENEISEQELVKKLYDGQTTSEALFYLGGDRDTYYQLMPGFYRKIFITQAIKNLTTSNTRCTITDFSAGTFFKAQECITSYTNTELNTALQSKIQHCYIPLEEKLYLAYEQVGNIVDGSYDLCSEIHNSSLSKAILSNSINSEVGISKIISELDLTRRKAIQTSYPNFTVDYEDQPCFAGCSVKVAEDSRDYYYAYITHGSGLPLGVATCFKVDPMMRVYKVGEFPDMTDSYMGYTDIDPKNCRGIK